RDIFAPVAARLAGGAALAEAGEPCDPEGLVCLSLPEPELGDGQVLAHAIYIDRFGNVGLNLSHEDLARIGFKLGRTVGLESPQRETQATYARTFADVSEGELLVYEDAYRRLAIAASHGNAAERLGLAVGDELRIAFG
ncbi:MAG: SAM-dependent chlorinase/fluorinase, partial [Solirubrobacterales bacterium]|nr:SAM-dependent chlorinase/fluorinase [Solirubrobacterales bacterium]